MIAHYAFTVPAKMLQDYQKSLIMMLIYGACDFLLVIHCSHVCGLYQFGDFNTSLVHDIICDLQWSFNSITTKADI